MKMDKLKKIFVLLGSLDRRAIFLIVGLSVLVPLLKPEWMILPIEPDANTQKVFNKILKFNLKLLKNIRNSSIK